jgi:hypothetical protein
MKDLNKIQPGIETEFLRLTVHRPGDCRCDATIPDKSLFTGLFAGKMFPDRVSPEGPEPGHLPVQTADSEHWLSGTSVSFMGFVRREQ